MTDLTPEVLSELVKRLRDVADNHGDLSDPVINEDWERQDQQDLRDAADAIEALEQQNILLSASLKKADEERDAHEAWGGQAALAATQPLQERVAELEAALRNVANACGFPAHPAEIVSVVREMALKAAATPSQEESASKCPPVPVERTCKTLCEDCPPVGYPTDKTRCTPCPRRAPVERSCGTCQHEYARHDSFPCNDCIGYFRWHLREDGSGRAQAEGSSPTWMREEPKP